MLRFVVVVVVVIVVVIVVVLRCCVLFVCRLCVTIFLSFGGAERLGVITGRIVLLDFCEFVDAVRGIF